MIFNHNTYYTYRQFVVMLSLNCFQRRRTSWVAAPSGLTRKPQLPSVPVLTVRWRSMLISLPAMAPPALLNLWRKSPSLLPHPPPPPRTSCYHPRNLICLDPRLCSYLNSSFILPLYLHVLSFSFQSVTINKLYSLCTMCLNI